MNSDLPLILSQIRPLPTNSDDITTIYEDDIIKMSANCHGDTQMDSGYITDFVLNHAARSMHPGVSIKWKHSQKHRFRHLSIDYS